MPSFAIDGIHCKSLQREPTAMNDLPSRTLKNPSNSSISAAKTGSKIYLVYSGIFVSLGVAFVLSTPLVIFTPLGQVEIMGKSLTHTVLSMGNSIVIAALIYFALAVPIYALCKKIACYRALYESYCEVKSTAIYATATQKEAEELKYETSFIQHVLGNKYNCMAVSSVFAAIIGYICYSPLVNAMDAPWAHLLILVIISMAYALLDVVTFLLANRSYKQENPELYDAAVNIDSN